MTVFLCLHNSIPLGVILSTNPQADELVSTWQAKGPGCTVEVLEVWTEVDGDKA